VASAAKSKGFGGTIGGSQVGAGVTGGFTIGVRSDSGFSGYKGDPFGHFQVFAVDKVSFRDLQIAKEVELRQAMRKPVPQKRAGTVAATEAAASKAAAPDEAAAELRRAGTAMLRAAEMLEGNGMKKEAAAVLNK
jgi:hypothetical protein